MYRVNKISITIRPQKRHTANTDQIRSDYEFYYKQILPSTSIKKTNKQIKTMSMSRNLHSLVLPGNYMTISVFLYMEKSKVRCYF